MKSTYVGTRSANVGDIRCLFALASDSTSHHIKKALYLPYNCFFGFKI